jgi:hypothetical protein
MGWKPFKVISTCLIHCAIINIIYSLLKIRVSNYLLEREAFCLLLEDKNGCAEANNIL